MKQHGNERRLRAALKRVWLEDQPVFRERLALLDCAVEALQAHCLDKQRQEQAMAAAHKLSGSLGMFGLAEASECAAQIEIMFGQSELAPGGELPELVLHLRYLVDLPGAN